MVEGYADAHVAQGLFLMRRASLLIRRLDHYLARHGLSQLRFLFLIVLDHEPERDTLTVGEITICLDIASRSSHARRARSSRRGASRSRRTPSTRERNTSC